MDRFFRHDKRGRMSRFLRLTTLWLWGGFLYYCVEMIARGYSHPSMYILGGLCFLLLGRINFFLPWELGLVWQALIGAAVVTVMELVGGLVINRWLGLAVWDYSGEPFNLLGQICLYASFRWIPLSAVGIVIDDVLLWKLFGEEKPHYTMF